MWMAVYHANKGGKGECISYPSIDVSLPWSVGLGEMTRAKPRKQG